MQLVDVVAVIRPYLSWPVGLGALGVLFLLLLVRTFRMGSGLPAPRRLSGPRLPYQRREALFTPAEQRFLKVIDQAIDGRYHLFGKVRIADVVEVEPLDNGQDWWRHFTKISSKHLDYVLCDRDSLVVVCAIELDDRSHDRPDRQERDRFVDSVCLSAGVPLLHFRLRSSYSVSEVRKRILMSVRDQQAYPEVIPPSERSRKPARTAKTSSRRR